MAGEQQEVRTGSWPNEAATARFAAEVAAAVEPGDVLALVGDLGSGKTTLARHFAAAFGVAVEREFSSPTYCYANEYTGRLSMVHMDLYRVDDEAVAESLGLLELLASPTGVVLVEWANKLPGCLSPAALWLYLDCSASSLMARRWRAAGPPGVVARLLGPPVATPP